MSTTRTRTAVYYRKGHDDALAQANACRKMLDVVADLHRAEPHGGAASLIALECERLMALAAEYEREAEVWIEDAAANGYGPEDWA